MLHCVCVWSTPSDLWVCVSWTVLVFVDNCVVMFSVCRLKTIIGFGVGAGANVLTRYEVSWVCVLSVCYCFVLVFEHMLTYYTILLCLSVLQYLFVSLLWHGTKCLKVFRIHRQKCLPGHSAITQMDINIPVSLYSVLFCSILFCCRLCPSASTAGSSPLPESSIFLCPLLSLSIPLLVAPQCHLSNFLCPLLSLSIPLPVAPQCHLSLSLSMSILLPVAPQCHLSNDVLVFWLIWHPVSATLCFW